MATESGCALSMHSCQCRAFGGAGACLCWLCFGPPLACPFPSRYFPQDKQYSSSIGFREGTVHMELRCPFLWRQCLHALRPSHFVLDTQHSPPRGKRVMVLWTGLYLLGLCVVYPLTLGCTRWPGGRVLRSTREYG